MAKAKRVLRAVIALTALGGVAFAGVVYVKHRRARVADPADLVPPVPTAPPAKDWGEIEIVETLYDGKLGKGWQDWGWGPHELSKAGPAKIGFSGYGGIILRHDQLRATFGGLIFRFKAPAAWGEFLQVTLKSTEAPNADLPVVLIDTRHVVTLEDGWSEARIGFVELNPTAVPFDRVVLSARTQVASDWVLIDRIAFTKGGASAAAAVAPQRSAALKVSCGAPGHAIDSAIYGSALGAWDSGQTAQRLGGNPTTRWNWDIGAWSAAADWFFENGKSVDMNALIDEAATHGAPTAITVPIIGWVAKDTSSVAFPAAKFPKQQKFDPHRPDVGNGNDVDGKPLKPGPPTETSIAAPPELIGRWVAAVREKDLARKQRAVNTYILDNEPALWSRTHRDIHPEALGYDELLDRTIRYATAIRKADPDAAIAGPAEWGWLGYWYSAKDAEAGKFIRPDRRSHGDVPLIPWYLKKLAEHQKETGVRLLDALDVHYYPASDKLYGEGARVDPEGRALRLRATRSLWDPSYVDESWINETIRLIPLLKEWVNANYPGLRVTIGEWSFGADHDISGGLATAEALGRFGQQALDGAYYWDGPRAGTATYWAFRAFRNYDGKGARFLDQALPTLGEEKVSLFASTDAARDRVVAILVNRDPAFRVSTTVALSGCRAPESSRVFVYREGESSLVEEPPAAIIGNSLRVTLPPYSITVLEAPLQAATPP